jgi:RNA polymerase I-specific transcription initiation factor RRN7
MALPLEIYPTVMQLAELISYTFEYPSKPGVFKHDPSPELKLVALVVIVVKLFYPFNSLNRHPSREEDPTVAVINWDIWLKSKSDRDQITKDSNLSYEEAANTTENEVFHMSDRKVDQYLDWFGKTWATQLDDLERHRNVQFSKEMFRIFPINSNEKSTGRENVDEVALTTERLKKVEAGLTLKEADRTEPQGKSTSRPGNFYRRYRRLDEMEEIAREFYAAAADVAGLPLGKLLLGVNQAEDKLEEWMEKNALRDKIRGRN